MTKVDTSSALTTPEPSEGYRRKRTLLEAARTLPGRILIAIWRDAVEGAAVYGTCVGGQPLHTLRPTDWSEDDLADLLGVRPSARRP